MAKPIALLLPLAVLASAGCLSQKLADVLPVPMGEPDASVDPVVDAGLPDADPPERALHCKQARSATLLPQRQVATAEPPQMSFDDLRLAILSNCRSCHLTPTQNGGFTFQDSYRGSTIYVDKTQKFVPGVYEVAQQVADELNQGLMPPDNIRKGNEPFYLDLGKKVSAWISAGRPAGNFPLPPTGQMAAQLSPEVAAAMTDIGDCIPDAQSIGTDAERDAFFAAATALPDFLHKTDLFTLDAFELAKKGTVAYDVEYPLWADNASKGRWVHVPATYADPAHPVRTAIRLDPTTQKMVIPDNARFYKTFFKQVTQADGSVRYRKIETRLIVVRHPPGTTLYGTYLWDDKEEVASLQVAPYRSGEPFKDLVFTYETDEGTHAKRTYAVPAKHRCNECHQGSESGSFILGFTPMQINRRPAGIVHTGTPGDDELSQVDRLRSYGVLGGVASAGDLPLVETSGGTNTPRNDYEVKVQAYLLGNCGHCHNPNGFATAQNPSLRLIFSPGGNIFQFAPSLASIYPQGGNYVRPGDPANSVIYKRVSAKTHLEGSVPLLHMPLHTPGQDCDLVNLVGKWITSIPLNDKKATPDEIAKALAAADKFDSGCKPPDDISWLEEDFTEPPIYVPRRADWNDPVHGLPDNIRQLQLTDALRAVATTPIAYGYWNAKSTCAFPTVTTPDGGVRPWMLKPDGTPKLPYGRVFYQTPGAFYFTAVCQKCHGPRANGVSGIAKVILASTGGATRVADLIDGLFGKSGANLKQFDVLQSDGTTRNLAGNYLIWMASGGTNAYFPPELSSIVGPNGGNMLNLVRQACSQLLPGHPTPEDPTWQEYEMYQKVCTFNNPVSDELGFQPGTLVPLNAALQSSWLDRAAQNAGWTLFRFFSEEAAVGKWPLGANDCDKQFPVGP